MADDITGRTVALWACRAEAGLWNDHISLSGLFVVDETVSTEPSAYQWEPGVIVHRKGDTSEDAPSFFISYYGFIEQFNPTLYGQILVDERMMDWAESDG